MEYDTAEMTRQYRLNFNRGEPLWSDGIPPEITSDVTGIRTTRTIDRASLLAWTLLNICHVETADLAFHGWIRMVVSTNGNFDEPEFRARSGGHRQNGVKLLRADQKECAANFMQADAPRPAWLCPMLRECRLRASVFSVRTDLINRCWPDDRELPRAGRCRARA